MLINAHNMAVLFTAVSTQFKNAFQNYQDDTWQKFARLQPVSAGILEMPFLEQIARMREWVGPRLVNRLSADKLTVKIRKFEETYEVPREAVEDDTYGMYSSLLEQMAQSCANLPNDLVEELLNDAASAKWCDGSAFFGTTRKYGKTPIANTSTKALTSESLKEAYTTMASYKGHGGDSLRVRPTVLIHGPALKFKAKELLENESILEEGTVGAAAVPNPTRGLVEAVELPGLKGNKWFLAAASGVIQPVYYFERTRPDQVVRKDQERDSNVFSEDTFLYGARGRASAAFVLPHLIYFGNAN